MSDRRPPAKATAGPAKGDLGPILNGPYDEPQFHFASGTDNPPRLTRPPAYAPLLAGRRLLVLNDENSAPVWYSSLCAVARLWQVRAVYGLTGACSHFLWAMTDCGPIETNEPSL